MERQINITTELLRRIVQSRGMLERLPQTFAWEDAFDLAVAIGQYTVPGFKIDEDNRFAYKQIARWLVGDPAMKCHSWDGLAVQGGDLQKGIYLQGPTGTGKTLCLSIFRRVAEAMRLKVKGPAGDEMPITWKNYGADAICDIYEKDGDILTFKREPVLCIQDLGAEPAEALHMGNRRNCLRLILEARGDMYDRITLVTSNVPLSKTGEFYGQRVQSRLVQMCNVITLGGADRRYKNPTK